MAQHAQLTHRHRPADLLLRPAQPLAARHQREHQRLAAPVYTAVRSYRLDPETAASIRTPLLITDPEGEQFWPGQSSQLSGLVPGRADVLHFGADEGAAYHCQPTGRLLTENRMFDWLAEFVPARRA